MSTEKEIRCAIYTRKSTDEGLEKEFNSLDAQREAAEAFIASQRHKGWIVLPERYDDGGYSGGNTNRPALKHLKSDIEEGKIDVVVVYKIDRLSRSINDFADLFRLFEKHHVEFVSVTQDINTATSAGRMMLNILMSFSQYEREIITERIRDKVAAAKKKGMHTGGFPPLGYVSNPKTHRLEIVPEQAALVRRIFEDYIRLGSAKEVACGLEADGVRVPVWTSAKGVTHGGGVYSSQNIYAILSNPLYIGQVRHYDKTYPGEHEAIVDKTVWDRAHAVLDSNLRSDGTHETRALPLRGLFRCGHCGGVMKESYSKRKGNGTKMYRYYVCGADEKRNHSICPLRHIAAEPLEALLLGRVSALLSTPEALAGVLAEAAVLQPESPLRRADLSEKFLDLAQVWNYMYPIEKQKFIRTIVREVLVYDGKAVFRYSLRGLEDVVGELPDAPCGRDAVGNALAGEAEPGRLVPTPDGDFEETVPFQSRYDGRRTVLVRPEVSPTELDPDALSPIQKAVLQGIRFSEMMETGQASSLTDLAKKEGMERTFLYHSLELVNLAPDIIGAILKGTHPDTLTLKVLRRGIPVNWADQRELYGFEAQGRA